MADVQRYFEQFHDAIRTDYDSDEPLRDKRDIILDKIRTNLKKEGRPSFKEIHQGSYAKHARTGVKPIDDLRYDIDVGLRFEIEESEYTAEEVRAWVFEAVDNHTDDVQEKGPCIRVIYADGYHVDLVCYAWWTDSDGHEQYRLAHNTDGWRPADPPTLLEFVRNARRSFEGTEDSATNTDQLRRCVRYLKRWYDEKIPEESSAKPSGLSFTLLCHGHLTPQLNWAGKADDRRALEQVSKAAFSSSGRINISKPTAEYEDVFGKLSDDEMDDLKERFQTMYDALIYAYDEPDPVKACQELQKVFGRDFPVPDPEETAKQTSGPAIVTASSSA
jgi:hypothetical protein